MDHPWAYYWPGNMLQFIRALEDTTVAALGCQDLKVAMGTMCSKYSRKFTKLSAEPSQR